MKIFSKIITFILVLIIIGGVGFLAWNIIGMSGGMGGISIFPKGNQEMSMNMNNTANNTTDNTANAANTVANTEAVQNREALASIISNLSDAINMISIDPYSKVTLPSPSAAMPAQQSGTTVNIYPNSTNTIVPTPPTGTTAPTMPAVPGAPAGATVMPGSVQNYVYNQRSLEQLHNGIFQLAQGMMLLNELSDDLTVQAANQISNDYQGYVFRYNLALQNRERLNRALNLVRSSIAMVNINPYGSTAGYGYDTAQMATLHNGIYKLAQGLLNGARLSDNFTNQAIKAGLMANNGGMGNMNGVTMNMGSFGNINISMIVNIVLIVLIITFVLSIFGAIGGLFKNKAPRPEKR